MPKKKIYVGILIFVTFFITISFIIYEKININYKINDTNSQNKENIKDNKEKDSIKNDLKQKLDFLLNSNFYFNINIQAENDIISYEGTYFDNMVNGTYESNFNGNLNSTNFQIENNKCYNVDTKNEISNVFYEANNNYFFLNKILEEIKDTTCEYNDNSIICSNNNKKFEFLFDKDYITEINIDTPNDYYKKYNIKYSNFNSTKIIDPLNEFIFLGFYSEEEENPTFHKFNLVYEYGLKNSIVIYKNEIIDSDTIKDPKILNFANYTKKYNDNITKYLFNNEYTIFIKNDNNENVYAVLTKNKYTNEVLNILKNK